MTISLFDAAAPPPINMNDSARPVAIVKNQHHGVDLNKIPAVRSESEVREQFQRILGELLYGQMLSAMRKNVDKPAYFHGGRAEEIFTQQLDQQLAREMSKAGAEQLVGPMFDLTITARR